VSGPYHGVRRRPGGDARGVPASGSAPGNVLGHNELIEGGGVARHLLRFRVHGPRKVGTCAD
jgi:hypothetical protein